MSVACGNKVHSREFTKVHHHDTVAQVRLCFSRPDGLRSHEEQEVDDFHHWEAKSEAEAERRNEQWFEERGGGSYAGSEEEARDRFLDSLNWEAAQSEPEPAPASTPMTREALLARDMKSLKKAPPNSRRLHLADETCNCPGNWPQCHLFTAADRAAQEQAEQAPAEPALTPAEVWKAQPLRDGKYTVETATGHRTFRLRTEASDSKFKPGEQVIAYLSGPDNQSDYTGFGTTTNGTLKVWFKHKDNASLIEDAHALLANPEGALKAAHCYRCHAELTTPESIALGMGPECRKKGI